MAIESQYSRNPANSGSLTGTFIEVLGKFLGSVDDMLPAVVTAYDRETNRATVRPLIKLLATSDATLSRAEIDSVPVLHVGGGGMVLSFNISVGDIGWIKANDRDISVFLKNLEESAPNTIRKHSFSDAVFIPDQFRKWTLGSGDDAAAVFQTLDASQRISIRPDEVAITSDSSIQLQTEDGTQNISILPDEIAVTSDASIQLEISDTIQSISMLPGGIIITSDVAVIITNAGLTVGGALIIVGGVNAIGDVIAGFGAASLLNHTHTYVPGTGTPTETSSSN